MGMRGKGKRKKTFGRRGRNTAQWGGGDGQNNGGRSRKKERD